MLFHVVVVAFVVVAADDAFVVDVDVDVFVVIVVVVVVVVVVVTSIQSNLIAA